MSDQLIQELRDEMRSGFSMLMGEIGKTNSGLALNNARLDEHNARLDENNARLDEINARLDEYNANLAQTNAGLAETKLEMREFRKDVNGKLEGITKLLIASERNSERLERRIVSLEKQRKKI